MANFVTGFLAGTYAGFCGVLALSLYMSHVREKSIRARSAELERIAYFPAAKGEQVVELERMWQQ